MTATRTGFALPMVVLLAMVVALAVSVSLSRQATQRRWARAQVESYQHTHDTRGVRAIADAWQESANTERVARYVLSGPDPDEARAVLDVTLRDGSRLELKLREAQGTLPLDLRAADTEQRGVLAEALRLLKVRALDETGGDEASAGARVEAMTRAVGPAQVSALTAPTELLAAIAQAAGCEAELAETFARTLAADRGTGERLGRSVFAEGVTDGARQDLVADVGRRVGLDVRTLRRIGIVLTTRPGLYAVRATLTPPEDGPARATLSVREPAAFEGLLMVDDIRGASDQRVSNNSNFLSWAQVPIEPAPERAGAGGGAGRLRGPTGR